LMYSVLRWSILLVYCWCILLCVDPFFWSAVDVFCYVMIHSSGLLLMYSALCWSILLFYCRCIMLLHSSTVEFLLTILLYCITVQQYLCTNVELLYVPRLINSSTIKLFFCSVQELLICSNYSTVSVFNFTSVPVFSYFIVPQLYYFFNWAFSRCHCWTFSWSIVELNICSIVP
jgi:hypothetical protein